MNEKNKFIHMNSIRREDQRQVMEEINRRKHCPFCREHLDKYHKKPIIQEGEYWLLTENQWPYEKTKNQLLAIYKNHIEHIKDMDLGAGNELIEMFADITKRRDIKGGGVAIRFGSNPTKGNYGSSVLHLHAHLVEPDLEALDDNEAWRFKFGQSKNYKK